ncbi:MAG: PilN domain-containing protein, partial [Burkholderiaceae bacterium]|nr:PilN domain-containing protein [Burkholderiaceae bacterium]
PRQKDATLAARIGAAELELRRMGQVSAVLQRGQLGNTAGYSEYFRALARQSVAGLWLTEVSISGAGVAIGVRGRALRAALVPDFIGRLGREDVMRGKTFATLDIDQPTPSAKSGAELAAPAAGAARFVQFHLRSAAVDKAEGGGE